MHTLSNIRRSPTDDRDFQYNPKPTDLVAVDLRPLANEVEFQDEIGAATSVSAQGGQGYEKLVEARDNFKALLLSTAEHYRIIENVEEEPD